MANDPAFLFYPGDYLRDTQCLSETVQVAYDRIICEHMRNICITQAQLNFFTKRLTEEQKSELMMVVKPTKGGFHIPWVSESIVKRREYSESRRKNRKGKEKDVSNISKTYVPHMENENRNENKDEILNEYENWTQQIFDGVDQIFEQMFMKEAIPQSPNIQFWIMDHRDLLNRYPKMRPPNQQAFRNSCLKHIRENYKKPITTNGNGTTRKEASAAATVDYIAKHYGTKSSGG